MFGALQSLASLDGDASRPSRVNYPFAGCALFDSNCLRLARARGRELSLRFPRYQLGVWWVCSWLPLLSVTTHYR